LREGGEGAGEVELVLGGEDGDGVVDGEALGVLVGAPEGGAEGVQPAKTTLIIVIMRSIDVIRLVIWSLLFSTFTL